MTFFLGNHFMRGVWYYDVYFAKGGKLELFGGPRLEANLRYEWLMAQKHFSILVESAFASTKSFFDSIEWGDDKVAKIDVLVLAMTYNVARGLLKV